VKNKLKETIDFLNRNKVQEPEILLILGSGLSDAVIEMNVEAEFKYEEIPHFKPASVQTHSGLLKFGTLGGKAIMAMSGRYHAYEGYSFREITYGVSVAVKLGVKTMIVTNISGGINKSYELGDFIAVTDHINLSGQLIKTGESCGIPLKQGVIAYLIGPTFETKAELRFLEIIGADVIGWSLVPEVIMARSESLEVVGICAISDLVNPSVVQKANVGEIFDTGKECAEKLGTLLKHFLETLA
jgi:purine-nucleoside phosphorylase